MSVKLRARHGNSFRRGRLPPSHTDSLETDLFHSCRTGNLGVVKKLVEHHNIGVNIQDEWDNSPLYLACLCGHRQVVEYLLRKGAQYSVASPEGKRCFLSALNQKIRDVLRDSEESLTIKNENLKLTDFHDFLLGLYERVPEFDVQLAVGTDIFLGHRFILAARSPYFRMILTSSESEDVFVEMTDPILTPEGFQYVLRYIYTGQLVVPGNMIASVALQAAQLGLVYLQQFLNSKKWDSDSDGEEYVTIIHKMLTQRLKEDLGHLAETAVPMPRRNSSIDSNSKGEMTQLFPDISLTVDGQVFDCHRVILYGRSEYFRVLLIENEAEIVPSLRNYRQVVELHDMPADAFAQALDFIYTDTCHLTEENCLKVLLMAERLALPGLKQLALAKVSECLKVNTVIKTYTVACELDVGKLRNSCTEFMAEHLEELKSKGKLIHLLKSELAIRQESDCELLESLQYHIRKPAVESKDASFHVSLAEEANEKLLLLQQMLSSIHVHIEPAFVRMPEGSPPEVKSSHGGKPRKSSSNNSNHHSRGLHRRDKGCAIL